MKMGNPFFWYPQGGGYLPDSVQHHKVLSLVPFGLHAVAVFPAYFHHYGYGESAQFSPSECVVFAEAEPPHHHIYPYERHRHKRRARQKPRRTKKSAPRKGHYHYGLPSLPPPPPHPHPAPVIYQEYHELLFGFRCVVTIIDQKICNSTYECETVKDYEAVYGNCNNFFFKKRMET